MFVHFPGFSAHIIDKSVINIMLPVSPSNARDIEVWSSETNNPFQISKIVDYIYLWLQFKVSKINATWMVWES